MNTSYGNSMLQQQVQIQQPARGEPGNAAEGFLFKLQDMNAHAAAILDRILRVHSRAFGPSPEKGTGTVAPVPTGTLAAIEEETRRLGHHLDQIASAIDKVDTII